MSVRRSNRVSGDSSIRHEGMVRWSARHVASAAPEFGRTMRLLPPAGRERESGGRVHSCPKPSGPIRQASSEPHHEGLRCRIRTRLLRQEMSTTRDQVRSSRRDLLAVTCARALPADSTHRTNFTQGDHARICGGCPSEACAVARESSSRASCKGRNTTGHDRTAGPLVVIFSVCRKMTDRSVFLTIS